MSVTRETLAKLMQFDHVIRVHSDGTVSEPGTYAPDCFDTDLSIGWRELGWTLSTGHSCQWGYHGPGMHTSEFIGGALADYILSTPGEWVCLVDHPSDDSDPDGWVLAYREVAE